MDNLTHSLIGAALGQAGLKRKTGLAMPALIIAANIPDIDAGCVVYGIDSLAMRRGITHGPIAMVVLPLLLAGALWWFDQWQAKRGTRPEGRLPVQFGWLLALCVVGCLSHPLFDWFNNYGVRLLEPFSSQWFYGDTLFIIDPWIIAMLGAGVWFSLRRERAAKGWRWPAATALGSTALYVLLNLLISAVGLTFYDGPKVAVANVVPITFWKREVLWRDDCSMQLRRCPEHFGSWATSIFTEQQSALRDLGPTNMTDPRIAEWSKNDPAAQAFLFWSRMPIAELHDDRIILRDQRFMDPRTAAQFSVTLRPPR
jgi:inner membrane protein